MNTPFLLTLWVDVFVAARATCAINARPALAEVLKQVSENKWEASTYGRSDVTNIREIINEQMSEYDIVEYEIEIH